MARRVLGEYGMVLVLLPVSLKLFDAAVNKAKKDGTLAQY